ncbi:MAG: bifunctional metallophosphatase/5'-nucleotidase [Anaerolineae bacterium]
MSKATWYSLVVVVALTLLLSVAPAAAQGGDFSLTVLHTNDVHARILQFNRFGGSCGEDDAAEGKCFGGVARRKTMIDQVRAEGGNVVLLDGGDQFQGTLFYNQYKGEAAQTFMNALGYDAMAVGNHEFDDGPEVLARFIAGANFPILSANIDASQEPSLADLLKPFAVLEIGGEQIGVIGYTTEDTAILSSPGPNVAFNNIEESVAAAVAELEAMGVNKIIAVSHSGFNRDRQVAAAVDGLDVIVAGHTNTFLSNTDEDAEGPYPVVVNSPNGNPVLLVSDFTWGKYLGRLDVTFDADGVPVSWEGEPILLDASVAEDPDILAQAEALNEPLAELRNTIVGSAAVDLNGDRASCRFEECNMGNLIADAIVWATSAQGTQIAIQNGGGIRASIPAGDVSLGDVLEVLPFGNTIATFELSGADVVAALENGVSRAENPENEGTGRFPQVAGLRYSWNPDLPEGSRIVSVEVKNEDGSYSPIDPNAIYKVAANNFMRGGGDGYSVFAENAINPYDFGPTLDEAVAIYIGLNSPVAPEVEGRISRVEEAAPETLPASGGDTSRWPGLLLLGVGGALIAAGFAGRRQRAQ